jgi:hypothetical protein
MGRNQLQIQPIARAVAGTDYECCNDLSGVAIILAAITIHKHREATPEVRPSTANIACVPRW